MAKLYLMRHGQTLFNVLKRKQGWCDSPLTEVGIKQVHLAGKALRERGYRLESLAIVESMDPTTGTLTFREQGISAASDAPALGVVETIEA